MSPASPTVHVSDGGRLRRIRIPRRRDSRRRQRIARRPPRGATTTAYFTGDLATGTPLGTVPTDPGTYTVVASFPGNADYAPVTSAPVTFNITRAALDWRLGSPGRDSQGPVVILAVYGQSINLGAAGSTVVPGSYPPEPRRSPSPMTAPSWASWP